MNDSGLKIKVVAIGGAGIRIAERLRTSTLEGFEIWGIDLVENRAGFDILAVGGPELAVLGSGGDPEVTERAAEPYREKIEQSLSGYNLVFILCGLGGGTASALAPIVAECAHKAGATPFSFATLPFSVEGSRRQTQAREALHRLRMVSPLVLAIPNDQLAQADATAHQDPQKALCAADQVISLGIRRFCESFKAGGLLDVDFLSFEKIFSVKTSGKLLFALGSAQGENAAAEAFIQASSCEILHTSEVARRADHLFISLTVGPQMGLKEVKDLAAGLADKFGGRGERLIQARVSPDSVDRIEILVLGIQDSESRKKPTPAPKKRAAKIKAPDPQMEMLLGSLVEQRGAFEDDDPNLYRGEDVDIPTYLRRGVKLLS
jgi:cell division protein FtsZ